MGIHRGRLAVGVVAVAVAGIGLGLACVGDDDVTYGTCTQLLCQGGSSLCCVPALPGTWDPVGRFCNCPPPFDPDADADGDGDVGPDADADIGPGPDADADADADADTVGPCEYPAGPYSFTHTRIAPPMSWASAVTGADETLAADTAVIRCDPGINAIFIQVAATFCGSCPSRMEEINSLKSTWEANGAKWIFVINDTSSATAANAYVERYGITFGWRTHDGDNTAGAGTIGESGNFAAVPWTGVIRTATMELVCDEPDTTYLDIEAISAALAADPLADLSRYCTAH